MLNTDIFKFEFVDRTEERREIDEYLLDFSSSLNYALWIHGERGTGKSFFLTEYIMAKKDFTSVYVNIEIKNISPGDYLKIFINQLNSAANLKFTSYLRANYKSIATIGQKAVNLVLNLVDLDDLGLNDFCSSITNYFISKQGEKENTVSVIKKYITEALKKCDKIVFLLDNFSQCDVMSLDIIISVIHELLYNTRIKFVICTTDDDLKSRFDIKSILAQKIPNKPMLISPFRQKHLFARMIENTFELEESDIKLLSQTFELCHGIPQRFKEILINLYATQGIVIDGDKAQFVLDTFNRQLVKGSISFDIDALCQKQKGVKTILQIVALWGGPIPSTILYDFFTFFADIDPIPLFKDEITQSLNILEELHILTRTYDEHTISFQFEHDSLKLAIVKYFNDDRAVSFLHYSIYEYLMRLKEITHSFYWRRYYQSLLAYHSFAAQADKWIDYNYSYGYYFFEKDMFKEAEVVFLRLETVIPSLSGLQLLTMGITFFYCGQYHKAEDILSNIQSRNLINNFSLEQKIKLFIFQARARSCILDNKRALEAINHAERLYVQDNRLRMMILGTKQSVLFLTPGGFQEAKSLFDDLATENLEIHEMAHIYQSAMDYYEGEKSKKYLTKGLLLARRFSDYTTEGKILNNIGFEYLRCGNYNKSKDFFEKSILILKEIQPHEQTFPYSNLAVLHMIFGNWEEALNNIAEALFWNKSDYASLVLKTNRMLCYYFSDNKQWEKIYRKLFEYINLTHDVDDKIYKKICINMALLAWKRKDLDEGIIILERCRPHLEMEWPHGKYRFLNLYQKLTGRKVNLSLPPEACYSKYYCELEFEPWLLNFSHD